MCIIYDWYLHFAPALNEVFRTFRAISNTTDTGIDASIVLKFQCLINSNTGIDTLANTKVHSKRIANIVGRA
jgi:hypothetical protein